MANGKDYKFRIDVNSEEFKEALKGISSYMTRMRDDHRFTRYANDLLQWERYRKGLK